MVSPDLCRSVPDSNSGGNRGRSFNRLPRQILPHAKRPGWQNLHVKFRCPLFTAESRYFDSGTSAVAACFFEGQCALISFVSFARRAIIESKDGGSPSNIPSAIIFS